MLFYQGYEIIVGSSDLTFSSIWCAGGQICLPVIVHSLLTPCPLCGWTWGAILQSGTKVH